MIVHLDLDCFFVSAERLRKEDFRGVPAVVANGSDKAIFDENKSEKINFSDNRGAFSGSFIYNKFSSSDEWQKHFVDGNKIRGLVVAASYEARSHNIKTGTTLSEALQRYPNLKIAPSDMPYYYKISKELYAFLENEIPVVEQYGIDEFFGDISGWIDDSEALEFAKSLQTEIHKEFGLPITIGVSPTKTLAKLAAKSAKPFGVRVVNQADIAGFIKDRKIESVAGIGKKTAMYLRKYGVTTLDRLLDAKSIVVSLGKNGVDLYREISGIKVSDVEISSPRKSVGISRVFEQVSSREEILRRAMVLTRYLSFTISSLGVEPTSFSIRLGYKHAPKSKLTLKSTQKFSEVMLRDLIRANFATLDTSPQHSVIYIGISAYNFSSGNKNLSLLELEESQKNRKIYEVSSLIRGKYGADSLRFLG